MLLEDIMSNAKFYGERIAINSKFEKISYEFLWENSDKLAFWIDEKLKDNKDPIVVYGHKSIWMIVCFLACVKSGRAYCPVDVSMPKERIERIVNVVDNHFILATEELNIDGYNIIGKEMMKNITERGNKITKDKWVGANDVFYIIFTSGSSGDPKGVEITYSNLSNFLNWSVNLIDRKEEKVGKTFLNQAPFSFDLSVMDLYTCLSVGGKLWCLDKQLQSEASKMLEYLAEGKLNYWVSTPSFADMCLAEKRFDEALLTQLKGFFFCGETLAKETAGKLFERFPNAKIINAYGPTESTVAVTAAQIKKEMLLESSELPIGVVKPGTEIRIDKSNNEIFILGDTVSRGYFKDKEKTKGVFYIEKNSNGEEVRCYKTGDEGYIKDGMLYYHGRIDLQIKLHGYRVELGDIEANLLTLPDVKSTAVVPSKADGKIKYLAAFVVSDGLEGSFEDRKYIRNSLKEKLPEYMVPKKVVFIKKLPITNNGKIDRKKLEESL